MVCTGCTVQSARYVECGRHVGEDHSETEVSRVNGWVFPSYMVARQESSNKTQARSSAQKVGDCTCV